MISKQPRSPLYNSVQYSKVVPRWANMLLEFLPYTRKILFNSFLIEKKDHIQLQLLLNIGEQLLKLTQHKHIHSNLEAKKTEAYPLKLTTYLHNRSISTQTHNIFTQQKHIHSNSQHINTTEAYPLKHNRSISTQTHNILTQQKHIHLNTTEAYPLKLTTY